MAKIFRKQKEYAVSLFDIKFSLDFSDVRAIENDPLIDSDESIKDIALLLTPVIISAVKKVGEVEFALLNPIKTNPIVDPIFIVNPTMEASILEYSQLTGRGVTVTTNRTIQKIIVQGLQKGEGLEVIRRNIYNAFDYFEKWRARRTAKTATFFASNLAGYESMVQSARVKETKWYNPSPCQYCAVYNGRIVEIKKKYALKDEVIKGIHGGEITVWRDTYFPPIHPNCQCVLLANSFNE